MTQRHSNSRIMYHSSNAAIAFLQLQTHPMGRVDVSQTSNNHSYQTRWICHASKDLALHTSAAKKCTDEKNCDMSKKSTSGVLNHVCRHDNIITLTSTMDMMRLIVSYLSDRVCRECELHVNTKLTSMKDAHQVNDSSSHLVHKRIEQSKLKHASKSKSAPDMTLHLTKKHNRGTQALLVKNQDTSQKLLLDYHWLGHTKDVLNTHTSESNSCDDLSHSAEKRTVTYIVDDCHNQDVNHWTLLRNKDTACWVSHGFDFQTVLCDWQRRWRMVDNTNKCTITHDRSQATHTKFCGSQDNVTNLVKHAILQPSMCDSWIQFSQCIDQIYTIMTCWMDVSMCNNFIAACFDSLRESNVNWPWYINNQNIIPDSTVNNHMYQKLDETWIKMYFKHYNTKIVSTLHHLADYSTLRTFQVKHFAFMAHQTFPLYLFIDYLSTCMGETNADKNGDHFMFQLNQNACVQLLGLLVDVCLSRQSWLIFLYLEHVGPLICMLKQHLDCPLSRSTRRDTHDIPLIYWLPKYKSNVGVVEIIPQEKPSKCLQYTNNIFQDYISFKKINCHTRYRHRLSKIIQLDASLGLFQKYMSMHWKRISKQAMIIIMQLSQNFGIEHLQQWLHPLGHLVYWQFNLYQSHQHIIRDTILCLGKNNFPATCLRSNVASCKKTKTQETFNTTLTLDVQQRCEVKNTHCSTCLNQQKTSNLPKHTIHLSFQSKYSWLHTLIQLPTEKLHAVLFSAAICGWKLYRTKSFQHAHTIIAWRRWIHANNLNIDMDDIENIQTWHRLILDWIDNLVEMWQHPEINYYEQLEITHRMQTCAYDDKIANTSHKSAFRSTCEHQVEPWIDETNDNHTLKKDTDVINYLQWWQEWICLSDTVFVNAMEKGKQVQSELWHVHPPPLDLVPMNARVRVLCPIDVQKTTMYDQNEFATLDGSKTKKHVWKPLCDRQNSQDLLCWACACIFYHAHACYHLVDNLRI